MPKPSKKKSTKKRTAKKQEEVPVFIKTSTVKDFIKSQDLRCAGDFPEALNKNVHRALKWAIKRAMGNNRGTVRPIDAL